MIDNLLIQLIWIRITTNDEMTIHLEAAIYGAFGIVRGDRWVDLYHIHTGLLVCSLGEESNAVTCANALNALSLNWSLEASKNIQEALELVREIEHKDGWADVGDGWRSHPRYRGLAIRTDDDKRPHLFASKREQDVIHGRNEQHWTKPFEQEIKTVISEMVLHVKQHGSLGELILRREFFLIHTLLAHVDIRASVRAEVVTIAQIQIWLDEAIARISQKAKEEPRG